MLKQARVLNLEQFPTLDKADRSQTVIIADQVAPQDVIAYYLNEDIQHFVQKSNSNLEREIQISNSMLQNPDHFFKFPLSVVFADESPSADTERARRDVVWNLSHPKEKIDLLCTVDDYVTKHAIPKSLAHDVRMVADELITNALIHGPFNGTANLTPDSEQVREALGGDPKKWPQIFAARSGDQIFVGCTDFYGSLDVPKMLKRTQFSFLTGPGEMINYGRGGARIGSYMVFDACTSMYLGVDEGRSTTILCSFPQKVSAKDRHQIPKNLHIIIRRGGM